MRIGGTTPPWWRTETLTYTEVPDPPTVPGKRSVAVLDWLVPMPLRLMGRAVVVGVVVLPTSSDAPVTWTLFATPPVFLTTAIRTIWLPLRLIDSPTWRF